MTQADDLNILASAVREPIGIGIYIMMMIHIEDEEVEGDEEDEIDGVDKVAEVDEEKMKKMKRMKKTKKMKKKLSQITIYGSYFYLIAL